MNNGTTTTTLARGCGWCDTCLRDCWGELDDGTTDDRGDEVLWLFEEACAELDRDDISWCPATSTVIGYAQCDPDDPGRCYAHIDGGRPSIDLESLRESCMDAVYSTGDWDEVNVLLLGDLKDFVMER
jgi:hypothetical protein